MRWCEGGGAGKRAAAAARLELGLAAVDAGALPDRLGGAGAAAAAHPRVLLRDAALELARLGEERLRPLREAAEEAARHLLVEDRRVAPLLRPQRRAVHVLRHAREPAALEQRRHAVRRRGLTELAGNRARVVAPRVRQALERVRRVHVALVGGDHPHEVVDRERLRAQLGLAQLRDVRQHDARVDEDVVVLVARQRLVDLHDLARPPHRAVVAHRAQEGGAPLGRRDEQPERHRRLDVVVHRVDAQPAHVVGARELAGDRLEEHAERRRDEGPEVAEELLRRRPRVRVGVHLDRLDERLELALVGHAPSEGPLYAARVACAQTRGASQEAAAGGRASQGGGGWQASQGGGGWQG